MRHTIKLITLLVAALLLAACATATPYRQAQDKNDYGYQEQRLEQDRYRVSFAGNSETDRQTVENYLLYRAAELTLQNGKDYFVVANTDTEKNVEHHSTVVSPAFSLGYGYRHGFGRHGGIGLGLNILNASFKDYQAFGVVVLKSGAKPSDNVQAYDARDVLQNLGQAAAGRELRKLSSEPKD